MLRITLSRHDVMRCAVDLTDVTVIDECSEKLLEVMKRAGAKFIASGVYINHVLEVINGQCEHK
jgi:predicted nucleic acid-binding Zn ribbon protein